jgi:2-polyprenyl-6-methoxyphenol hydroxylase-like FAD-dependent oxidoreductase
MSPQVLIAGAGPVGMTMAIELTRYGVPVRIVDKAARPTDKSKALVLWSRTLELLDRAGGAGDFLTAGMNVNAVNIVAGNKPMGHVSLAGIESPYPFALMIPQSETERLLNQQLNRLGITVEREVEITSFTAHDTGVKTILRHADGRDEVLQTEWLVGCDGAHSAVRHGLALPFEGNTLKSDWMLADIHLAGYPFPESEMAIYWHQDGVLVVFPISPGRFRVIADFGLSQGAEPPAPTLEQVQAILNRRGPAGLTVSDPIWLAAFRINERKVTDYRAGRAFVAGDAAHVHSPAGGQGMNTGMQDAFNLAWKLALVCRGDSSECILDSYSIERSTVGEQVLQAAGRLTKVATMKNHTAQTLRNMAGHVLLGLAPFRKAMVDQMSEVTIGYPDSPLTGAHHVGVAHPHPGERAIAPDGKPIGGGGSPLFTLFAKPSDDATEMIACYPDLLEPAVRAPFAEDGIWLVRPDGYTALAVRQGAWEELDLYLAKLEC